MPELGLRVVMRVSGFDDAKRWIYRMIDGGVVKCHGGNCDEPATHVHWQDRAEWYPLCEEHREYGEMWTGSTGWNPSVFGINVLPIAREWFARLDRDPLPQVRFEEYDKTDYYALLDSNEPQRVKISRFIWVHVRQLTDNRYVYAIEQSIGNHTIINYGLVGAFPSACSAVKAAKDEIAPSPSEAGEPITRK